MVRLINEVFPSGYIDYYRNKTVSNEKGYHQGGKHFESGQQYPFGRMQHNHGLIIRCLQTRSDSGAPDNIRYSCAPGLLITVNLHFLKK
jgi:hypothetical protein